MPLAVRRARPAASAGEGSARESVELTASFGLAAFSGGGRVGTLDERAQTATVQLRRQREVASDPVLLGRDDRRPAAGVRRHRQRRPRRQPADRSLHLAGTANAAAARRLRGRRRRRSGDARAPEEPRSSWSERCFRGRTSFRCPGPPRTAGGSSCSPPRSTPWPASSRFMQDRPDRRVLADLRDGVARRVHRASAARAPAHRCAPSSCCRSPSCS